MKNPNSTNRLFDLDRQLDGDRPSPPPPTEPSPSGSGSLFHLEKAVGKPNQPPQPQNHPSPSSPSGSGSLFHLEKAVGKPNQPPQSQNHHLQVRSFDDGGPIEMVTAEDDRSPMEARAFDFNEDITVQQQDYAEASSWDEDYAEASSWDEDYADEMATGDVPFQAESDSESLEAEEEVSQAAEFTSEVSPHSDALAAQMEALRDEVRSLQQPPAPTEQSVPHSEALAKELEALRQEMRSLQQPPAPTEQSSPQSEVLDARLKEIRDEVKQLQWQKQQPPEQTEALATQMEALREELKELRDRRETEALSNEYWEALELEPTFQDFDREMDEEQSPSRSEAAQHVPVEVIPPEAPHSRAKAMEVELAEQFAEFDRMMELETADAMELAEGLDYGSGLGAEQYASQLGVETIEMYLDANRTGASVNDGKNNLCNTLITGTQLDEWVWGSEGRGAIILYQGEHLNDKLVNNEKKEDELAESPSNLPLAPILFLPRVTNQDVTKPQTLAGVLEVNLKDSQRIIIYEDDKENGFKPKNGKKEDTAMIYQLSIPQEGLILGMAAKRYDLRPNEPTIKLTFKPLIDDKPMMDKVQHAQVRVAPWMMTDVYGKTTRVYLNRLMEGQSDNLANKSMERFVKELKAILEQKIGKNGLKIYELQARDSKKGFVQDAVEIGYSVMPGKLEQPCFASLRSPLTRWKEFTNKFPNEIPNSWFEKVEQESKQNEEDEIDAPSQPKAHTNKDTETMSFGNLEVTPPLMPNYPAGRIYYSKIQGIGKDAQNFSKYFYKEYEDFLSAQKVQKPFILPANWLEVGHVDEVVCFLPVHYQNYKLAACIPSSKKAYELLTTAKDTCGARKFLDTDEQAKKHPKTVAKVVAQVTAYLTNQNSSDDKWQIWNQVDVPEHMSDVVETLYKELAGPDDLLILEVPVLFHLLMDKQHKKNRFKALTSNMVNMLIVDQCSIFPKPFGPIAEQEGIITTTITHDQEKKAQSIKLKVEKGDDIFEVYMNQLMVLMGLEAKALNVWDVFHVHDGEIHCGTNTKRTPLKAPAWWTFEDLDKQHQHQKPKKNRPANIRIPDTIVEDEGDQEW